MGGSTSLILGLTFAGEHGCKFYMPCLVICADPRPCRDVTVYLDISHSGDCRHLSGLYSRIHYDLTRPFASAQAFPESADK